MHLTSLELINQGAEAKIYLAKDRDTNTPWIIKERLSKAYRHPILEARLFKKRSTRELKILEKLYAEGLAVPKLCSLALDGIESTIDASMDITIPDNRKRLLIMEYIDGPPLGFLMKTMTSQKLEKLASEIGILIRQMHDLNVIHGDLTLSNI